MARKWQIVPWLQFDENCYRNDALNDNRRIVRQLGEKVKFEARVLMADRGLYCRA